MINTGKRELSDFDLEHMGFYQSQSRKHMNLLDKTVKRKAVSFPIVEKNPSAPCPVTAVDHLVEQMTASLDFNQVSKEQRMATVAEAFMKIRQIEELGHTLLSDEELTAPASLPWSARNGTWGNILDYIVDQYESRIGRGFVRSHLKKANMPAYDALRNWLRASGNTAPSDINFFLSCGDSFLFLRFSVFRSVSKKSP